MRLEISGALDPKGESGGLPVSFDVTKDRRQLIRRLSIQERTDIEIEITWRILIIVTKYHSNL